MEAATSTCRRICCILFIAGRSPILTLPSHKNKTIFFSTAPPRKTDKSRKGPPRVADDPGGKRVASATEPTIEGLSPPFPAGMVLIGFINVYHGLSHEFDHFYSLLKSLVLDGEACL